jgi:hypothetical protein
MLSIKITGVPSMVEDILAGRAAVCEAVLNQRTYAAIVMSEDSAELDTAVWTAVARKNSV